VRIRKKSCQREKDETPGVEEGTARKTDSLTKAVDVFECRVYYIYIRVTAWGELSAATPSSELKQVGV